MITVVASITNATIWIVIAAVMIFLKCYIEYKLNIITVAIIVVAVVITVATVIHYISMNSKNFVIAA